MADLMALKQEQEAARAAFNAAGEADTAGKSYEDLIELDIAYKRAMRRYHAACDAYNAAIEEMI